MKESPLALAALRIVIPLVSIVAPGFREGVVVSRLSPASFVVPEGLGWFVRFVPIRPEIAIAMQLVAAFAALCAAVGVHARLALAALFVSLFYLYSIAQLTGFVWHDMHILWMIALLAASPCADALSYDAGFVTRAPHARYALPLWFARGLLACVYFFPGVWKLATQGFGWALSDNLRNQLWWKWAEHGEVPSFRIDRIPYALEAGGLFVLAFELSFPVLILFRRVHPWVAIAGIVFHVMAELVFRIPFVSLMLCYFVLVEPKTRRLKEAEEVPTSLRPIIAMGGLLLLGAIAQGARGQMSSYPFACYPTFQWNPGTLMPDLFIEVERANGETAIVDRGPRSQREWGTIWSLAGVTGPVSEDRLRAYYTLRFSEEDAVRVSFYRAYVSVVPEERSAARQELLLSFRLRR